MKITPHARTVDALLQTKGNTLANFIATHRDNGQSYAKIALALYEYTDHVVQVTGETIRNWAEQYEKAEAASA